MHKLRYMLPFAVMILMLATTAQAGQVTPEQARRIATNWLTLKIQCTGNWGSVEHATVADVIEFTRGDRLLGYYCPVEPHGYILVSLYEGLAPTKAYSETDRLDLAQDDQSTDLPRRMMEAILNSAEKNLGALATVTPEQFSNLVGYNHIAGWTMLDVPENDFAANLQVNKMPSNYYEGQYLLTSCWNQNDPYNRQCPPANPEVCDWDNCATGCAATAAAQIMRYWSWPPEWDWLHMPDTLQATDPPEQINATAAFNRAVGDALGLEYCNGSCATSYPPSDGEAIEMFYQSTSYHSECTYSWREDNSGWDWFQLFVQDFDRNRPIQYRMPGHQVVSDGYYLLPYPHYHMNWGHGGPNNAWFAVDTIPRPEPEWGLEYDYIVHRIVPHGYLGPSISGVFPNMPDYPWRYVDRDCQANTAYFTAGNLIQFLPYLKMECASGYLRFDGQPGLYTRLFSPQLSRGIRIEKGSIVMHEGGGIQFRLQRP